MIGNNLNFAGSEGQLLISSLEEEWFFQGKSFAFEDYFSFSTDETKTFVLDPTAFTGDRIVNIPIILYSTGGPFLANIYVGTDADDDGTLLTAVNRRIGFPAPKSIIRLNPTVNSNGLRIGGDIVTGTGNNPATATGGSNIGVLPIELSTTLKTMITLENTDGDGIYCQIKFTWFEI